MSGRRVQCRAQWCIPYLIALVRYKKKARAVRLAQVVDEAIRWNV